FFARSSLYTIFSRDWSSVVCSSVLSLRMRGIERVRRFAPARWFDEVEAILARAAGEPVDVCVGGVSVPPTGDPRPRLRLRLVGEGRKSVVAGKGSAEHAGRATCRDD